MSAPSPRSLSALALALLSGACSSSTATATGIIPPTAVVVDPVEFLGAVPCASSPGALHRYVATLVDVSVHQEAGRTETPLPSSLPTPCYQKLQFENVILPGRQYAAKIDGYDRTDLHPAATGSADMLDGTGTRVSPRWTASCGRPTLPPDAGTASPDGSVGEFDDCRQQLLPDGGPTSTLNGPVCAYLYQAIVIRGCTALVESTTP